MSGLKIITLIYILTLTAANYYRPVIGIFAEPYPENKKDMTKAMIEAPYIQWLQASGADSYALMPWLTNEEIDEILPKLNGILFVGGERKLSLKGSVEKLAAHILTRVIEINKSKVHFPLFGICQGFQLLHMIVSNNQDILENFDAYNLASELIVESDLQTSNLFKYLSNRNEGNLRTKKTTLHFHYQGVSLDSYSKSLNLRKFFKITTLGKDRGVKVSVESVEGRQYPIYATQFHPEKSPWDVGKTSVSPIDRDMIAISNTIGQSFIEDAKQNENVFPVKSKTSKYFVNTFTMKPQTIDKDKNFYYFFLKK